MKFFTKLARILFFIVIQLNRVARANKIHHQLYAYYAFPVLVGLVITFTLVRTITGIIPGTQIVLQGVHFHHFMSGIFILLISGYIALWVRSFKLRYATALAYGSGMGFIFDEFYVWLRLDSSVISHSQYDSVIIVIAVLLIILLLPSGLHALRVFLEPIPKR